MRETRALTDKMSRDPGSENAILRGGKGAGAAAGSANITEITVVENFEAHASPFHAD